ncbi:ABC transporter permease [Allobacillus sp. GCM10007491]|uniref:ABC transporter permease n=1 Tax=Allobacillus saliphilus TaxID=2912308 RepID=A0A941HS12_9BACI|nr:ABC transporter permease [Allobacillus saliphilus]MBR7552532.1 ABC transporter permease [Allobacillus saliphilus]
MEAAIEKTNKAQLQKEMKKQQRKLMLKRLLRSRMALTGFIILIVATIITFAAPLITSHDPLQVDPVNRLQAPSADHYFGTDDVGRDVFSRVVYGIQESMFVGLAVAFVTAILGIIFGLYSAYYNTLDHIIMRINDGLMAFPSILLAIAIMAALGPKTVNVIIALSVVYTPLIARVVRSSALVIKEQTYIEAMKSMGGSSNRIIWRHIAPNTLSPLLVQATFVFAMAIINEAMLSFLGAGIPAPEPSLGNILYDGKNVITKAWWMTLFPGLAVILITLGLNMFGDGMRDILDPHSNKSN